MTLAIVLIIIAALALLLILRTALMHSSDVRVGADPSEQIQPIDLEAFRNLIDPAEADYLRQRLTVSEFRRVQRERLVTVVDYVKIAAKNAAVLVQIGQDALVTVDPSTAETARQLVKSALLLRRNCALVLIRIYLEFVWPRSGFTAAPVLSAYEKLNGLAMLLGRLHKPAWRIRIAAS